MSKKHENKGKQGNLVAKREEEILSFWQDADIFQKSLDKKSPRGEFVFYDGPPFATGLPHQGTLLGSVAKDLFGRYKTMQGYYVRRRWGWDTHGLPIENMVEKELGLKSKKDIEALGIEKFNEACRGAVLRYAEEWKRYVDRVGRWVEYDNSYKTMDRTFMESVWWTIKSLNEKGLLYEGRKVLLYCPHCETPLAKAEIAMDNSYKNVTDIAVTVKFKVKNSESYNLPPNTYLLAWTTTPWTLPGNVALAVGEHVAYSVVKKGNAHYVLAEDLVEKYFGEKSDVIKTARGGELVGLEYKPLFDIPAVKKTGKRAFYVSAADFVNTEEGTGIVHTAVIYGEDDFTLGLEMDLPMVPLLNAGGMFNEDAPDLVKGIYFKKSEKIIIENLSHRDLIEKQEQFTHSYPHCYRCDTPLYYSALPSWFIDIQKIKSKLIKHNEDINWHPNHLKHGRFLNIVKDAPDWAISRNRYWASALPIWKCEECERAKIIGSLEELTENTIRTGNHYFIARHGHAESNERGIISSQPADVYHITDRGKKETKRAAKKLKDNKPDIIFSSVFIRTRETAEIIAKELGMPKKNIIFDSRIQEIDMGEWNGKKWRDYYNTLKSMKDQFLDSPKVVESYTDVRRRVGEFLYELEQKYRDKKILIVSHGSPISTMYMVAEGADQERGVHILYNLERHVDHKFTTGDVRELPFVPLPHNSNFEVDIHRPYIDRVELVCSCGSTMKRIPEVLDCWVESGSMPFAEYHYPFENEKTFEKRIPADYVAEYIAQTRTWYYYTHVISVALFGKAPFRNIVNTGTLLAESGEKISKSKKNYTDPLELFDMFGADSFRHYLMTSVLMQSEDLRFSDEGTKEVHNRVVNILWNVFTFYKMYGDNPDLSVVPKKSRNVLDKWILARLGQLIKEVTTYLDGFNTIKAGRLIKNFITDLSTWYVRRSRTRFKSDNVNDRNYAVATTRHVLLELSKIIAPFMPFIAESIYTGIGGDKESVHLDSWPRVRRSIFGIKKSILSDMEAVRNIVSLGLEARATAGIKVRQPLATLMIKSENRSVQKDEQLINLIKEEVNVKNIEFGSDIESEVNLDTKLTSELEEEGNVRELIRAIQSARRDAGLKPQDVPTLFIDTDKIGRELVENNIEIIKGGASLGKIEFTKLSVELVKVNNISFGLRLQK